MTIVSWVTAPDMNKIIDLGPVRLHLIGTRPFRAKSMELKMPLDRAAAWQHWVLPIPAGNSTNTPFTRTESTSAIVRGGYLMRTAVLQGQNLYLTGDINDTATVEVLGGAPNDLRSLYFNGKEVKYTRDSVGILKAVVELPPFSMSLPTLNKLQWKIVDSLPEIRAGYSDALWSPASLNRTYNTAWELTTPTSLFASDYGYHLGHIVFRGTFMATGFENSITLSTRGGSAFGESVWLNDSFLGSWPGHAQQENRTLSFRLGQTVPNNVYTITVVLDNLGHNEDWVVGTDESKRPIGILDYSLDGRNKDAISWKISGNFGGEEYVDRARGPLNEGGLWAERQGFHLPAPPSAEWRASNGPTDGLDGPGIALFTTAFDLNIPKDFNVPLSLVVGREADGRALLQASGRAAYRLILYVNGWQFGKYINNIGPQTKFPVPEGIWNYRGSNQVSVILWNLESGPVFVDDFQLVAGPVHYSGLGNVKVVDSPRWTLRNGTY
jgi:hypothetical protein